MVDQILTYSQPFPAPIAITGVRGNAQRVSDEQLMAEYDLEMESSVVGLSCLRGMAFALSAEVFAAMSIYGVWRLWHLFR